MSNRNIQQDDPAFNTPEAAAYVGVKPNTLENWRSTGRYALEYEKIGSKVIYRKSKLDSFRVKRTRTSTAGQ